MEMKTFLMEPMPLSKYTIYTYIYIFTLSTSPALNTVFSVSVNQF